MRLAFLVALLALIAVFSGAGLVVLVAEYLQPPPATHAVQAAWLTIQGAASRLFSIRLAIPYTGESERERQIMSKLHSFKARARALARSGYFYGLTPLEFELSFEEGFDEAREWLVLTFD